MKKRKKKVSRADRYMIYSAFAAAAGIMILSASAVVSVHAYLSAQTDVKNNPFSPKNFTYTDISINEPGGSSYTLDVDGTTGTFKSQSNSGNKTASVSVTAGGDKKPVFIRATMTYALYDSNGVNITRKYPTVIPAYVVDNDKWTAHGGDSGTGYPTYYYYKEIVVPGSKAEDLIKGNGVTIANADQLPSGTVIKIRVLADAVQAVSDDDKWTAADYLTQNYATAEVHAAWDATPTLGDTSSLDLSGKINVPISSWSFS